MDKAIDYAIQISHGLAKAHSKEIIHRDIKPANLLVTEEDVVKIVDFGLAKLTGRTMLTKEATILGTASYMSPEQTQGSAVDHRTDIWALGVVLYEMLTGRKPFEGDYEQAVMYSIMNEVPDPIPVLRENVPSQLISIVEKTLQKNPIDRFQTTKDMLDELKTLGKSVSSIPEKEAIHSVAVLPFANMSHDKEQEYFCDGMAEDIINDLAHLEGLQVVARTSSFAFKAKKLDIREIGMKLGANSIVEGSVRKSRTSSKAV